MATITTKFDIGDKVFRASTTTTRKQHPCPDCLGSKVWKATSPAGRDYEFGCPRCSASYHNDRDLILDYTVHEAIVYELTIGRIEAFSGDKRGAKYMCEETGIGSGQVFNEDDLFRTREEAEAQAAFLVVQRDEAPGWVSEQFKKSLAICDYQLSDAKIKSAEGRDSSRRAKFRVLFDRIDECETLEEVRSTIEEFEWS